MHVLLALLSSGPDGRWQPSIGDPTVMGWLTVLAYLASAALAFRRARLVKALAMSAPGHDALWRFWSALSLLLLLLGINKQLDLQTLMTQLARDLALSQGWYEERRRFQVLFIAGVFVFGVLGTLGLAFALRKIVARIWPALLGLGFLVSFILIRAASFHHVDLMLRAGPVHLNWVFELTGIGLIALAARQENLGPTSTPH